MNIELLTKDSRLIEEGIQYFWKKWGNDSNFVFYKNCIENSFSNENRLPKFYLMLEEGKIIGSYALLINDIISRQDLLPWFACLYVNEGQRGQGLAEKLLQHGLDESKRLGFDPLYLSTDITGFYEKKGWEFYSNGYGVGGDSFKIYSKSTR